MRGGWAPSGAGPRLLPRPRRPGGERRPRGLPACGAGLRAGAGLKESPDLGAGWRRLGGDVPCPPRPWAPRWARFWSEPGSLGRAGQDRRGGEPPRGAEVRLSPGSSAPDTPRVDAWKVCRSDGRPRLTRPAPALVRGGQRPGGRRRARGAAGRESPSRGAGVVWVGRGKGVSRGPVWGEIRGWAAENRALRPC